MSYKTAINSASASKVVKGGIVSTPWVRNPSWLALPSVSGQQKMVGLMAVFSDSNLVAVNATTSGGSYTVDWGDGLNQNYSTNVATNHEYNYATFDSTGSTMGPVTFLASSGAINRTAHGYTNGMQVQLYNITGATNITEGATYIVGGATANSFYLTSYSGGSAVYPNADGTATLLPYKQAIVTITPSTGNLTSILLGVKNSKTSLQAYVSNNFLDIAIEGQYLTAVQISGSTASLPLHLEQLSITGTNSITSLSGFVSYAHRLQSIPSLSTGNITSTNAAFSNCWALVTAPNINMASVTDATNMFVGCVNLMNVPSYNMASCTNFSFMFSGCSSLVNAPYFNTVSGTNFASMFASCYNLQSVPAYNVASGNNFSSMFYNCSSITSVPKFVSTSAVSTNCTQMFYGCSSLLRTPSFSFNALTNTTSMFYNCGSLAEVGLFNTSNVPTMSAMFQNCRSLITIPKFDTSSAATTSFSNMFNGCTSLQYIPYLDTHLGTDFSSMFNGCTSLAEVPVLNTSNATNLSGMFGGCMSLTTLPALDTSKCTNFSSFVYVISTYPMQLVSMPAYDLSASTNNGSLWWSAPSCVKATFKGTKATISYSNAKLSKTALEDIFTNLGVGASQTITVSGNHGAVTPVALSSTTTASSSTIALSNTTGINVGDTITGTGTGLTTGIAVTISGNAVNLNGHNLANGEPVSFSAITSPVGVVANTVYYVVNSSTNSFQIASTVGGSALTFSGTAVTLKFANRVVTVNTGLNVIVTGIATSSGTNTLSYRALNIGPALLKGWTVTGG